MPTHSPMFWSRRVALAILLLGLSAGCERRTVPPPNAAASSPRLMTPQDLLALPSRAPDRRVQYGQDSSQYGELRVPPGAGPHPVVVLVHGGCFKAAYANTRDLAPMADALKDDGIATWNIEYRRLGEPGGGWPGTYLDVGRAVDHLRTLAGQYRLDLGRLVVAGHSAGGHLAMWAAGRSRLPRSSPLYMADPMPVRGVIDLAGPVDLTANIQGYEALCRDSVITSLLGGTPATVPERYAQASAIKLLPLDVPQVLVAGTHEDFVPLPLMEAYAEAAKRAGDSVQLVVIAGAGHFEIASPRSSAWPNVETAIRSLLDGRLPANGAPGAEKRVGKIEIRNSRNSLGELLMCGALARRFAHGFAHLNTSPVLPNSLARRGKRCQHGGEGAARDSAGRRGPSYLAGLSKATAPMRGRCT